MRQLTSHLNGGFNSLRVTATDNPPQGVANCRYDITGFNTIYNNAANDRFQHPTHFSHLPVIFQHSPLIDDVPQDGITVSTLLAICADHLEGKLAGPEARVEHQMALEHVASALHFENLVVDVPYVSEEIYHRSLV